MSYLAVLLLAPWLAILGWAYWAYPKSLPHTLSRRLFDALALLLASAATWWCAMAGYRAAIVPSVGGYGRSSGAIWQQVLPALQGYGACVAVLLLALYVRHLIWRHAAST